MPRRTGAGRIGGVEEARQLVALVAALNETGDVLSADSIVSRLGVSRETAMKMLMLIMTAGDAEDTFLSVSSSDDCDLPSDGAEMTRTTGAPHSGHFSSFGSARVWICSKPRVQKGQPFAPSATWYS